MSNAVITSLNFSWLDERKVAGSAAPMLKDDLDFLWSQGIRALLRLAYSQADDFVLDRASIEGAGFHDLELPVRDFAAPTQSQIDEAMRFISSELGQQRPVCVSCGAGCGRTGTILACYLVMQGHSAQGAVERVVQRRPCSEELVSLSPKQYESVKSFARRVSRRSPRTVSV
jgi:atypical dual specificity phosphatase